MATYRNKGYINYPNAPVFTVGKTLREIPFTQSVASGTPAAGEFMILAGALTPDERLLRLEGAVPAITGATSCDLGFYVKNQDGTFSAYKTPAGVDKSAAIFSAQTFATAVTYQDLLTYFASSLDRTKNIADLIGITSDQAPVGGLYLGLKFTNAPTTTGNLIWNIVIEPGNSR